MYISELFAKNKDHIKIVKESQSSHLTMKKDEDLLGGTTSLEDEKISNSKLGEKKRKSQYDQGSIAKNVNTSQEGSNEKC